MSATPPSPQDSGCDSVCDLSISDLDEDYSSPWWYEYVSGERIIVNQAQPRGDDKDPPIGIQRYLNNCISVLSSMNTVTITTLTVGILRTFSFLQLV